MVLALAHKVLMPWLYPLVQRIAKKGRISYKRGYTDPELLHQILDLGPQVVLNRADASICNSKEDNVYEYLQYQRDDKIDTDITSI